MVYQVRPTNWWLPNSRIRIGTLGGVFVPRTGATAEDDGWLLTFVHDGRDIGTSGGDGSRHSRTSRPHNDSDSGALLSRHLDPKVVMGGEGLGFPASRRYLYRAGFCLQFDRGEAKVYVAPTAAYTVRPLLLITLCLIW